MPLSPGLLKKLNDAKASTRGNRVHHGRYLFEIHRVLVEAKRKGTMFIFELGVVESEATVAGVEPNAPKSTCSQAMNLDTNEAAASNVKGIVMALFDITEDEADEVVEVVDKVAVKRWMKELDKISIPSQPLRGLLLGGETYEHEIQTGPNKGKPYVGMNYQHIEDQTDAGIKARRAAIDAGEFGTAAE